MRDVTKSPVRNATPQKDKNTKKRQRSPSVKRGRSVEKSPAKTVKRCTKSKARKTPNKSPKSGNKRQKKENKSVPRANS